ncbi:hypothetical protein QBC39DRAFT_352455 [Podospora conica]|nr:hypothetical protein QBC39DRAFT_352455 [Schizothecium conicum]
MAPQTRNRGKPKAKAPESRTYQSTPVPQQVLFPPRKKVVKTCYGRKSAAAALEQPAGGSARSLRQQTLTQIDYIHQAKEEDEDEDPLEPPTATKGRPSKRRKTFGDAPNSSSFHTQTLTQFMSEKPPRAGDDEDDPYVIKDSEEDDDDDDLNDYLVPETPVHLRMKLPETPLHLKAKLNPDEVPSSQPTPFTPVLELSPILDPEDRSPLKARSTNANAPMPTIDDVSKIPRHLVIQDTFSQSDSTLSSLPSDPVSVDTPSERRRRQPLTELPAASIDLGQERPFVRDVTMSGSDKENRKRVLAEIPDSDDDLDGLSPTPVKALSARRSAQKTPTGRSSQYTPSRLGLSVKFSDVPAEVGLDSTEQSIGTPSTTSETGGDPGTPTPAARRVQIQLPPPRSPSVFEETPQKQHGKAGKPSPGILRNKISPFMQRIQRSKASPAVQRSRMSPALQRSVQRNTQRQTQRQTQRVTQRQTQARSQLYSQGLESQRVPFDVLHNLGPITDRSDYLVNISAETADRIATGHQDHEFREYKFPAQAVRCWVFIDLPVGQVKYMASLGPPKKPGEIEENGVGNAEFNKGESRFNFAHEILQVYELNNPVPLAEMQKEGLGEGAPPRWRYVPPAIVGKLLGNLRCALFGEGYMEDGNDLLMDEDMDEDPLLEEDPLLAETQDGPAEEETDEADITVSQELAEQIRSDIIQQTQIYSSHAVQHEVIPASQDLPTAAKRKSATTPKNAATPTARPSSRIQATVPATARRSSSRIRSQRQRSQEVQKTPSTVRRRVVSASQATTASNASSPNVSPEKSSVPRPPNDSGLSSSQTDGVGDDTPVRLPNVGLSGGSSQGMMMDSLLVDDVRPPPEILDSDDDDDDYY